MTTTVARPARWPAPHVPELLDVMSDAGSRLDAVYDLLDAEPIDRDRLRLALDDLAHHLTDNIHTAVQELAMGAC